MILTEFDAKEISIVNPNEFIKKIDNFPKIGVTCFSKKLIDRLVEIYKLEQINEMSSANGKISIYKMMYKGKDIVLYQSQVGAPAAVVNYEEILAMGLEKLVVFGTCGVLFKEITDVSIIIPTSAIRDEGTSYHYMKESNEVIVNENYIDIINKVLDEHGYSHTKGKSWTTDAPYRETKEKMMRRRAEGCVCVEMECSALAAVSKFRNKKLIQFFYAADNLDSTNWDIRSLGNDEKLSEKERVAILAFELAINM